MKNHPLNFLQESSSKVTLSILGIGIVGIGTIGYYFWNAHQENVRTQQACRQAISPTGEPAKIQAAAKEFLGIYSESDFYKTKKGAKGILRSSITDLYPSQKATLISGCVLNAIERQVPNPNNAFEIPHADTLVGSVTATNAIQKQFYPHTTFFDAGTQPSCHLATTESVLTAPPPTPPSRSSLNSAADQHPCLSAPQCDTQGIAQAGCR